MSYQGSLLLLFPILIIHYLTACVNGKHFFINVKYTLFSVFLICVAICLVISDMPGNSIFLSFCKQTKHSIFFWTFECFCRKWRFHSAVFFNFALHMLHSLYHGWFTWNDNLCYTNYFSNSNLLLHSLQYHIFFFVPSWWILRWLS